jgi:uncharacterized protein (DUF58 family)
MRPLQQLRHHFAKAAAMANHDFCPWANRYVYWLKDPVGWFVIATVASLLVGAFLSPLGWAAAAGLAGILLLGLGFPWIAVRTVHCELSPLDPEIHERDSTFLELSVRNRLPIPIMGLMIEEYFTPKFILDDPLRNESDPDVGLSLVPGFSTATYRLPICPEYRGRYPKGSPKIACSFPFGIWTARRGLDHFRSVIVWPLLVPLTSEIEISGNLAAEVGNGLRPSSQGDFIGVRDFRRGDSLRSIHWVQTARTDSLIVCERGGPQKQAIELHLRTDPSSGSRQEIRENLAWRIRFMASLIDLVVSRHYPFRLYLNGRLEIVSQAAIGKRRAWELLTDIPLDGLVDPLPTTGSQLTNAIDGQVESQQVSSFNLGPCLSTRLIVDAKLPGEQPASSHQIRVAVEQPGDNIRRSVIQQSSLVDLDQDIEQQLNQLLMEACRESYAT